MGKMKALKEQADDVCEACADYGHCYGCTMFIKQDGKEIEIDGGTREIKGVRIINKS